jgi:hypothetical protein
MHVVRCMLLLQEFGKLAVPIMAKVYHKDDNGAKHGVALKNILYSFTKTATDNGFKWKLTNIQYLKP